MEHSESRVLQGDGGVQRRPNASNRLLFFAVLPDAEAKEGIAPLILSSQGRWGLNGPVRPARVWHATLQGIGPDEPVFRDLAMYVGGRVSMDAFDVSFNQVMTFKGSNAFVLTGEGSGVAPLHELHRRITAELRALRYPLRGSFKPHLTMLYDRRLVPKTKLAQPVGWRVKELVLVCSHQGLTRHDYVARWPLIEQPRLI